MLNQEACAPHLHVHGADHTRHHPTTRSPDHRVFDLCDHSQSPKPYLLLLPWSLSLHVMLHLSPTHHEKSKHDSPHEHEGRIEPRKCHGFKFKPRHVNDSAHIKPRHWPLDFSNMDLPSRPVIYSTDSLTTIKSNYSISIPIPFFKSPSSSISAKLS
jgi:hypothetical protein